MDSVCVEWGNQREIGIVKEGFSVYQKKKLEH